MIRKYAVEIYFTLFGLFIVAALVQTLGATLREEQAPSSALWLVIIAFGFFIAAMVAAEVREAREERLYNSRKS